MITFAERFPAAKAAGRKLLVPYITGGYPGWTDCVRAAAANGADAIEIGIPFSDPVMDGPRDPAGVARRAERRGDPAGHPRRGSHARGWHSHSP